LCVIRHIDTQYEKLEILNRRGGGIIQFTNYYHNNHWLTILKITIYEPKILPF